jgi:hypothetical protein
MISALNSPLVFLPGHLIFEVVRLYHFWYNFFLRFLAFSRCFCFLSNSRCALLALLPMLPRVCVIFTINSDACVDVQCPYHSHHPLGKTGVSPTRIPNDYI